MKTTQTREITPGRTDQTVASLRALLQGVPDDATWEAHVTKGDRPWESDSTTVTVTWTEEA